MRAGLRALLSGDARLDLVGEAGSVAEAIEASGRLNPDVLLLDIRLPDGTGIEVCRAVRAVDPGIQALMITSFDDDDARVLASSPAHGTVTVNADGHAVFGRMHPPGDEKRIFEKFYRSNELLSTDVEGSGLGLAIARRCTELHGGTLAIESTEGRGTTVVVRLPDEVAGLAERETNAQGTGAWGAPASVLLRCGVEPPGPTTERCVSVDGVDWIIDETDAPRYLFTTYGRTPAVEVLVDNDVVSGSTAIADLSAAVSVIPAERECTNLGDVQ